MVFCVREGLTASASYITRFARTLALGYRPPAPVVLVPAYAATQTAQNRHSVAPRSTLNQHPSWTTQWGRSYSRRLAIGVDEGTRGRDEQLSSI